MTRATITTKLDTDNPWPGLESYCEDAQGFFYGRGHECEKLLKKVLDAPVTVLFGRSGLGKTSLLHAGLFPLLRNENFLPIYVRFDLKPGAASLSSQLHDAVRNAIGAEAPDALLPRDDESLWEYLHRADLELWSARNYLLTPVIVLDQFEELFTLGAGVPDQVEAFKYDLADLAENRIPAELAVRIKNDPAEARRFNLRAHNCKLLISLREDFLAHLEDWCRFIPALGRARMRLLPLGTDEAFDAVYKPAEHLMTPELAHQVVGIIAGAGLHTGADSLPRDGEVPASRRTAGEVEPTLLSLVCRELNEERKRLGKATFDEQLVDEHGRSTIPNYYISCVSGMRAGVAEFIENQLITKTGFRDFEAVEDAVPSRLTPEELDQLISSRLVRLAEYHGTQRIELVHDVLTGTVREHRDRREAEEDRRRAEQQKENEKAAIAAAAEQERQALAQAAKLREAELDRERLAERDRRLESEKAAARRLKWALVALAIACTTALVLAGVAFWQRGVAQTRSREARIDQLYVNSQLMLGGLSPLGSHDVKLLQMLLAAQAIPSTLPSRSYELLTTLNKERDLLKIIDLPVPTKALSLSRDGSRIVSGGGDDVVRLWSSDGRPVGGPMRHEDKVTSVAFSPDGSRIVSGGEDDVVRLWSSDGRPVGGPMSHEDKVTSVAFSPDGSRIVSGGEDDVVRLWSSDGRPVGGPMRHEDKVTSVAFSPDGSRIASASQDGTVQLWDTRTGRQVGSPMIHPGSVNSVAFSADGTRIATGGSDRIIRLFSVAKDQSRVVGYLLGHESAVNAVAFDADKPYLASASSDGTVRLWDLRWQRMVGHDGEPWAGYFDDGRRIGSGSSDKTVRWWDPTTGQPIGEPLRVDDPDAKYLFPADEHRLVSFGSNDDARLWDARTGTPIGEPLRVPGEPYLSTDYRVTRIAAQLEPRVVQVYRTDSMQPVGRPVVPAEDIWRMSFSHDGRTLATAGDDGTIELWNADTGDRLGPPMNDGGGPAWSIEFSPDGHLLAAGNEDYNLRLWRTDSFTRVGEPLALEDALATATAFSSDGRMVAAGGDDGTIRLWNVADQTPLGAPISVHNGSVMSMQFSSDGTRLLSASDDNTLRIWPVLPADPNLLCAKLTHVMTRDQWKAMVPGIEYQKVCQLPESEYAG
ncbi:WD40 repeat domain-containing protein [Mycobacterium sp. DBP42]|uniref:nSTAND1 domain-containing NTPase n=1 Tax=Mycobacterium sp. DBP42 TaxID=2545267 RepID=UPI00110CD72F|nr:WD40 repeat domain-containing protein [Mycobacterium sp. DBP42]TMS51351.1 WD40 repeat domain-containing protein [Mycobacterium sp. DBP42]